jgi:hypothetical protein
MVWWTSILTQCIVQLVIWRKLTGSIMLLRATHGSPSYQCSSACSPSIYHGPPVVDLSWRRRHLSENRTYLFRNWEMTVHLVHLNLSTIATASISTVLHCDYRIVKHLWCNTSLVHQSPCPWGCRRYTTKAFQNSNLCRWRWSWRK